MKRKLILLSGPAGIGKTTIARKYAEEHPLTLRLEGDSIISMIGDWRNNEEAARKLKFSHIVSFVRTHLQSGYDVILPYLVTDNKHVMEFENVASENNADFTEIMLSTEKEMAVKRLLKRGAWGEEGSRQLTDANIPRIESLYDLMMSESTKRENIKILSYIEDDIETTYANFLSLVSN